MASLYRVSEQARNEASCSWTYRTAVNHAARHRHPRWKLESFSLQGSVHLANIIQLVSAFGGSGPVLDQLQDLGANIVVDRSWTDGFEQRDEIIHELFGGDLGEEMLAAIFDASVCKLWGKSASQNIARVAQAVRCFGSGLETMAWPGRHTFKALSCVFGFLSPMRFLRERMASFGGTVLDLMTSDISRFRAMSSLWNMASH